MNCSVCGRAVPFGGGRTVKNAEQMYSLVNVLGARLKPGSEGAEAHRFVEEGKRLADQLHAFGHKDSVVNPDWGAAGLWTRHASSIEADKRRT